MTPALVEVKHTRAARRHHSLVSRVALSTDVRADTGSEEDFYYDGNQLNQYTEVSLNDPASGMQRLLYDADGNLTEMYIAGDIDCDGDVDFDDIDCFDAAMGWPTGTNVAACSSI